MVKKSTLQTQKKRLVRVGSLDSVAKIVQFERKLLKMAMKSAVGTGGGVFLSMMLTS